MKRSISKRNLSLKPIKTYIIIIIILLVIIIFCCMHYKSIGKPYHKSPYFEQIKTYNNIKNTMFKGAKIVHLDLKGAPPKITYYEKLFPLLSQLGATGILIEYEDMFPYKPLKYGNISALNAYNDNDIKRINILAKNNNLDVIPLVQTFGHLEFVLKLNEYKEFREVPEYPQAICPNHEDTLNIIIGMIDQIVEAHPNSKILHIGADEVYYLGICDRCVNIMTKYNLSKNNLFIDHINAIVNKIHHKYPHLKLLMWDDEFRSFTLKELNQINRIVQPVVWKYSREVYEELGPSLWDMYSMVFPKIWAASAFKGATGSNQFLSDVTHYVQNHRSWMSLISEYKNRITFEGVILTGWQRYDHFAILCELLPVAIPSLAMSLRVLLGYNDSPLSPPIEVAKLLGCEQPYALIGPVFGSPKCHFPGGEILEKVLHLQQIKLEFDTILDDSRTKGWFTSYNIKYSFSNPQYIVGITAPLSKIKTELSLLDNDITNAMFEVYDNVTINEWKETYLKPLETQVNQLWEAKEKILAKDSWPRRPIHLEINSDL